MERKPLSKKTRFEVFKRDKFTCQYCGRKAPDVVLEIDHIKPVADGGDNDIMNLVTSCFDCNRGKGKRKLDDNTVIKKQKAQLEELALKNEQLEMMLEWRKGLLEIEDRSVNIACEAFSDAFGCDVTDSGKKKIKKYISSFSLQEILEAIDIAENTYEDPDIAFSKISGICNNRRCFSGNQGYYYNYFKKAAKDRFRDFYDSDLYSLREFATIISCDEDFEIIKNDFMKCRTFLEFSNLYNFGQ